MCMTRHKGYKILILFLCDERRSEIPLFNQIFLEETQLASRPSNIWWHKCLLGQSYEGKKNAIYYGLDVSNIGEVRSFGNGIPLEPIWKNYSVFEENVSLKNQGTHTHK